MMNTHAELVYPELLMNNLNTNAASCFGARMPNETAHAIPPAIVQNAPNMLRAGRYLDSCQLYIILETGNQQANLGTKFTAIGPTRKRQYTIQVNHDWSYHSQPRALEGIRVQLTCQT
jgi:hypothetical protein